MTQIRNSNIELLRIISMLMVSILHFNAHCAHPGLVDLPEDIGMNAYPGFLLECLCIIAVNCFILISGYFGINLKLRSVLKLYMQCFLVGMLSYLLYVAITPEALSLKPTLGRFFAFTHNHWWFVILYLGLMFVSPLLNTAVEYLSKHKLLMSIVLYGIVIWYFGWWKHMEDTNSGYSLICFIWLYLIARYIGKYVSIKVIRQRRWWWLVGYLLCSAGLFGLIMLRYHADIFTPYVFSYDHPLVVASAVCLLLFFLSLQFQSRVVNWFAASAFTAYLLQESPYFGKQVLYPWVADLFTDIEALKWVWVLIASAVFMLASVLLDKLLQPIIKIVLNLYDKYIHPRITKYSLK